MSNSDQIDLAAWVDEFTGDLYSWALHKTSSEELARDLVQDTFMAVAEKPGSFKGDSSVKTWLFSILNHKIIDYYRKKTEKHISLDQDSTASFFDNNGNWIKSKRPVEWADDANLLDDEGFRLVMDNCIDELPEKWRICITSKYLLEKNSEEVCQELEIKPTNYWQVMHRAKLQLRECIEINWFKK